MLKYHWIRWCLFLVLGLSITGCSGRLAKHDMQLFWVAPPVTTQKSAPAMLPVILGIARPTAEPGFATRRMTYRDEQGLIHYYAHHQWLAEPAQMIALHAHQSLEQAKMVTQVVTSSHSAALSDVELELHLLYLYQDFTTQPSTLRLGLKVRLIDKKTRHILGGRTWLREKEAGNDAKSGAQSFHQMLTEIDEELPDYCYRILSVPDGALSSLSG